MNESCIELTEPFDAEVVATAHSAELATPKRTSLPSMLPPGFVAVATWIRAEPGEHRVARALADVGCDEKRDEDERHRGEQRPALPRVADHLAEGVAERRADQQDRQQSPESSTSGVGFSNGCAELTL